VTAIPLTLTLSPKGRGNRFPLPLGERVRVRGHEEQNKSRIIPDEVSESEKRMAGKPDINLVS